ncbi:MAG: acetyl-CoA carboxylase biotin carboxyl carrier protein [Tepidibacter sp.]|jgi:acetyl-CoA carboxylase biotin carboxyl carrier protein|uniref:acetyl-CoA carboxylase biotin carboxyl carrier protein n=1 Tax=Tepidibacter sp. TaxID=2529387 RepID=UPI0025FF48C8|nr:acetyl-CoA carboxylase biotin carboxyl carrier protein [Tepidibacter sp.]MCT4509215.1 acetyl-CoA carboxylase biotin carboxyl carrier protein [Tepidibacter sp.]
MNINEIKELIMAIDKTSINKFDIEMKDLKLSIQKGGITSMECITNVEDEVEKEINIIENKEIEKTETDDNTYIVNAPIMGTFYSASSPEAGDYVNVGNQVKKGDTLCILEAMKLMNEIECDVDGEIIEILVENEELVEYDQPLFKIKVNG